MERLESQIEFLLTCDRLKSVARTTYLHDASRPENSAEHSWHLTLMALTLEEYAPAGTVLSHAVNMLIVHDLVEIYAGDTCFSADQTTLERQHAQEEGAASVLFSSLPAGQGEPFRALWDEFEARSSPSAVYARALDVLQPMLLTWGEGGQGCSERGPHLTARRVLHLKEPALSPVPKPSSEALGLRPAAGGAGRGCRTVSGEQRWSAQPEPECLNLGYSRSSMLLLVSKRYSDDSRLLMEAARIRGWEALRLQSSSVPPGLRAEECCVYAEGFLAEHLAAQLGLVLARPPHDALARIAERYTSRKIRFSLARDFRRPEQPAFIKPADQKLFAAGVYAPGEPIAGLDDLHPEDPILVSEVVNFECEYRFFVAHAEVRTGSVYWLDEQVPQVEAGYEGQGDPFWSEARAFAQQVCGAHDFLPVSYVVDVGRLDSGRWAVTEFNPVWASGIYGCSPLAVLDCLAASQH